MQESIWNVTQCSEKAHVKRHQAVDKGWQVCRAGWALHLNSVLQAVLVGAHNRSLDEEQVISGVGLLKWPVQIYTGAIPELHATDVVPLQDSKAAVSPENRVLQVSAI